MIAKIGVSIVEREVGKMIESSKKAKELGADLVELRLDFLPNLNEKEVEKVTKKVREINIATILTIRKKDSGGFFPEGREKRLGKLLLAGAKNVDFVDLELETNENFLSKLVNKAKNNGAKVIISSHNLKETPSLEEIIEVLKKEKEKEADICKFVCHANELGDNLKALAANLKFKNRKVVFCSGKLGRFSRIMAPLFGSEFTFASLERGKGAMSGQIDIQTTRMLIEKLRGEEG